jgi:hypothetical protein
MKLIYRTELGAIDSRQPEHFRPEANRVGPEQGPRAGAERPPGLLVEHVCPDPGVIRDE